MEKQELVENILTNAHELIPQYMEEYAIGMGLDSKIVEEYLDIIEIAGDISNYNSRNDGGIIQKHYENNNLKFEELISYNDFNISDSYYNYTDPMTGEDKKAPMFELDNNSLNYQCNMGDVGIMLFPNNILITKKLDEDPVIKTENGYYEETNSDHSSTLKKQRHLLIQLTENENSIIGNYFTYDNCEYDDWKSHSIYNDNFKLEKSFMFEKKTDSINKAYESNNGNGQKSR